tara:strand:+ start:28 stop:309 length:282 start_codon:yes stop_codon:yes gene_type:complete
LGLDEAAGRKNSSGQEKAQAIMEITPFPNSVNVPYYGIDKLRDAFRVDSISRNSTKEIAAITRYSEFVYEYRSGEIHTSIIKVSRQDYLDLQA